MLSPSFDCVETVAGVFGWHRGEAAEVHSSDELSEHLEAIQDPLLPQSLSFCSSVNHLLWKQSGKECCYLWTNKT